MSNVLALEYLYSSVSAAFVADAIQADNVFGWRTPAKHPPRPRVAWVPGDPSGSFGPTLGPRNPGGNPRALGMTTELFTLYFTATNTAAPDDEQVQYHIVRMLRDAWFRAAYRAAHGTFVIRDESWVTDTLERRSGATLRMVCELQAPILDVLPDAPLVLGPDAGLGNAVDARPLDGADIDGVLIADNFEPPDPEPTLDVAFTGDDVDGTMGIHTQSTYNKNMAALATAADGDLACATALAQVPALDSMVSVSINGLRETNIGNGVVAGSAGYFSGDGGVTARAWNLLEVGDLFYWQGSVAGYELTTADSISFWFEQRGGS